MLKVFKHIKPADLGLIFISLIFTVTQVGLELKLPDYMKQITELVQTPGGSVGDVYIAGAYMLICALCGFGCAVIVGYFAATVAASFSRRLRTLLFDKVQSFSTEEISLFSTASLITRSTNDVTQVQMLIVMGMQVVVRAPVMAVWAITKIAGKGREWSLTTAAGVLIVLLTVTVLIIFVMPKFRKIQLFTDNLTRVTRENLMGLRVVRAYNAESFQNEKFEAANSELTDSLLFTSRALAVMMPVMTLVMSGLSLAIYWAGAYLLEQAPAFDKLNVFSDMVVFSQYAVQVIMSFMMLSIVFVMLPRAGVSAKRINEVLDTKPVMAPGEKTEGNRHVKGEIVFDRVGFRYPGAAEAVLEDISFKVNRGETVAFIGSTGSGKSTLINLIPRFFDATEGEVSVDGINVKDYEPETLFRKIGYVPQKAVLFRGSVKSNVAYGDNGKGEYTEDEIKRAALIAQAADFIESSDGGYDAEVSQGGANLSGGQKQRLAIARAICRNPEILIFDDSLSALDYKTERALRSALKKEIQDATCLIVAQRIGTIMDADRIIVLEDGKLVGNGAHRELLESCPVYREIAESQLSLEEI
ncbi:MAG: ABC transporter ATP-binding protein/permease [Oscillospiraceae bacterium]|nr:ABC transporter ATP-binding protein/permease [Oscillospiraceae bacterium]